MATVAGGFSGRSQYRLELTVNQDTQFYGSNVSRLGINLNIFESPEWGSWSNTHLTWALNVHNGSWGGSTPYDFRNYNALTLFSAQFDVAHDANGYLTVGFNASVGNNTTIGNASCSGAMALSRIPKPPAAPTPIALDTITPTSMRYRFGGNSDNGAAIIEWQIQYATNEAFTAGVVNVSSGGTSTLTPLSPATRYWVRSRGRNSQGWGPYSSALNAQTLSGAYVSDGANWIPREIYLSESAIWETAIVQHSNGSAWLNAQ